MPARSFTTTRLILPAACCFLLGHATLATAGPPLDQPAPESDVKALLKERLATVTEIHELLVRAAKQGSVSVGQVIRAKEALLDAKLALCDTQEERIAAHTELVQLAEQWQQMVAKLAEGKEVPQVEVLRARAHLLDARIALAKAKAAK